jgi:phosphoglycolate phosphatase-like HAD superfamily hydrolase
MSEGVIWLGYRPMKDAVIADLDGTLCDVSGILHHVEGEERDFAAFHAASADCPPHDAVVEAVRAAHDAGKGVLVVTSREFVWRDLTLDWLVAHEIPYDELVMRIVGDYRPDHVVKADMLDQLEADGWSISEAWEDSADIIELWESRGIAVHAV